MFEATRLRPIAARRTHVGEGTPERAEGGVSEGRVTEIDAFGVDEATVTRLRAIEGVTAVTVEDHEQKQVLVVQTSGDRELTAPLLAELDGFEVGRVASREPTLEDAYIALVTAE
jgi:ABC-2 type transport system ATP-binding protein